MSDADQWKSVRLQPGVLRINILVEDLHVPQSRTLFGDEGYALTSEVVCG